MSNFTIKQHYVWRYYLSPWTSSREKDGQIFCLMDNKIFSTGLMRIANQHYFNKVPDFTERHIRLAKLYNEALSNNGNIRKLNEKWIDTFEKLLVFKNQLSQFIPTHEFDKQYDRIRNIIGESYHTQIEQLAIKQLDSLRSHDSGFLCNEEERINFYFYLSNQLTRTKRMRDKFLDSIARDNNKPEGYGLDSEDEKALDYFAKIFIATNLGFALSNRDYGIAFVDNDCELSFITGDQPVINTHADYLTNAIPDKFEIYYPLTPKLAILVFDEKQSVLKKDHFMISIDQVDLYNRKIAAASLQQIYANDQATLERYRKGTQDIY